jgi:hypothetical protein
MPEAEQSADIALSQTLLLEMQSRPPCLHRGLGPDLFRLLAGLAGLGYFVGQGGIQHGHDLDRPYLVRADAEVQCQQVTHHILCLVQAPGLSVVVGPRCRSGTLTRKRLLVRATPAEI